MHQNGLSYLIIELEDSGQPVQGIQPKNNNKGNPQMFGKRLSTLCNMTLHRVLKQKLPSRDAQQTRLMQEGSRNTTLSIMMGQHWAKWEKLGFENASRRQLWCYNTAVEIWTYFFVPS